VATGRARGEDPHAVTVADALAALNRLCLPVYDVDVTHKSGTDKDAQQEKKDKTTVMWLPKPSEHQRRILDALRVSYTSYVCLDEVLLESA